MGFWPPPNVRSGVYAFAGRWWMSFLFPKRAPVRSGRGTPERLLLMIACPVPRFRLQQVFVGVSTMGHATNDSVVFRKLERPSTSASTIMKDQAAQRPHR